MLMHENELQVGIVIVNWNSFDVLSHCLKALREQTEQPYVTIVVDNNSDDAPEELTFDCPKNTRYIRLAKNTGFARANNIAVAMLETCDFVVLLNPDAFPKRDWLENLLGAARRRPEFSCFSSMTIIDGDPDYLDGAGDVYHISGIAWRRGYERHIVSAKLKEEEVFAPCAAAAMYRRDAWEGVGGFDEEFFCYFEDVDLAFRMRLMGHKCLFVPSAVAYHMGSATTGGQQSDFSVYYGHRNLVWTYIKDMPGYAFWVFLPLHIVLNILTVMWFTASGRWRVVMRAKWDAIRGIPNAWVKRKAIQERRSASVGEVIRVMDRRMIPRRRPGKRRETYTAIAPIGFKPWLSRSMMVDEQSMYFTYLRRRSLVGLAYRRLWLYPRLAKNLSGKVLDIGCGIGDFLAYYYGAVGVDINHYAVDWCKRRGLDARLMDEDRLPFSDNAFDSIVLDNVLEHLSAPAGLLCEVRRVLAPGGRLVVGVPGERGYESDPDHKVFYGEDDLLQTMRANGFSVNTTFYMPFQWRVLDRRLPQYCLYGVFEQS